MAYSVEQGGMSRRDFVRNIVLLSAGAVGASIAGPAVMKAARELENVSFEGKRDSQPDLNNMVSELDAALARCHVEGESLRFDATDLSEGEREFASLIHNIEMNDHSKERRGEELAKRIWDTVARVHTSPDPNREPGNRRDKNTKRICGLGLPGQGLEHVVAYVVEVALDGGKTRTLSVLFGSKTTGEIVHITSVYDRRDFQKVLKRFGKKGLTAQNCGDHTIPRELLNPDKLFE